MGVEKTKYLDRPIPTISLASYESRIDEITSQLVSAAENVGFFSVIDHGITPQEIDEIFAQSARFFDLPDETKAQVPFSSANNAGWEKNSQVRPSTGAADRKESYQMQFGANMEGKWLDDSALPGFKDSALKFMWKAQGVSEKLMTCFARGLGFEDDYFIKAHNVKRSESQTVARLLHYFETPKENKNGEVFHRAGAHTDWDLLTLLFQKEGQSGLEICPGREASTSFAHGDTWTKVAPSQDAIICNIGDLLMSWSDDRFKSTFHRVKAPSEPDDFYGERYSIAFFNQPCRDVIIQGPLKKYPVVTGEEFTRNAMRRNFEALEKKRLEKEKLEEEMEKVRKLVEREGIRGASVESGGKVVAEIGA
ncbi:putative leucoanthocyanidin dioxygenase [Fonsecaea pedrosoi]|nr:putative leucoanthocyanidin dioxygenase [Fonsecaea pedrosoi]